MSEKPPFTQRSLVFLFSIGIVLISGSMLRQDIHRKDKASNKIEDEDSKEKFMQELRGEVDVAKASISPDYLKQVVDTRLLRGEEDNNNKPEIKKSLKERAYNLMRRVMP